MWLGRAKPILQRASDWLEEADIQFSRWYFWSPLLLVSVYIVYNSDWHNLYLSPLSPRPSWPISLSLPVYLSLRVIHRSGRLMMTCVPNLFTHDNYKVSLHKMLSLLSSSCNNLTSSSHVKWSWRKWLFAKVHHLWFSLPELAVSQF